VPNNECYIQFIYSNEYMSVVTIMIAFFVPVSVMMFLYVRVWWETVKRQKELVHLQAGKKHRKSPPDMGKAAAATSAAAAAAAAATAAAGGGSKRSDSR
jgi:hypothetical protein